jgi:hypothetical protein
VTSAARHRFAFLRFNLTFNALDEAAAREKAPSSLRFAGAVQKVAKISGQRFVVISNSDSVRLP